MPRGKPKAQTADAQFKRQTEAATLKQFSISLWRMKKNGKTPAKGKASTSTTDHVGALQISPGARPYKLLKKCIEQKRDFLIRVMPV